eukprot:1154595-Pelagomonas_calceolata.AAC.3
MGIKNGHHNLNKSYAQVRRARLYLSDRQTMCVMVLLHFPASIQGFLKTGCQLAAVFSKEQLHRICSHAQLEQCISGLLSPRCKAQGNVCNYYYTWNISALAYRKQATSTSASLMKPPT